MSSRVTSPISCSLAGEGAIALALALQAASRLGRADDLEDRRPDDDEQEEADHQRTERGALLLLGHLHLADEQSMHTDGGT